MSYHLKVLLQTPGLLVRLFKLDKFGGKILPSAGFLHSVDLVPIELFPEEKARWRKVVKCFSSSDIHGGSFR